MRPSNEAMNLDRLPTPHLVLDVEVMEANIATAFALAGAAGTALRPHAKSHKCVQIAGALAGAGAIGACVATLAEAEALAAAGVRGLLLTAPFGSDEQVARVAALHASGADLMVVADHPDVVARLDRAVAAAGGGALTVLVDCDPGMGRTGVADAGAAVALAAAIGGAQALRFGGVQFYYGNLQHIRDYDSRRSEVTAQADTLRGIVAALEQAGTPAAIVTGGGTGTLGIDLGLGVFTELQPGSFLFMDSDYAPVEVTGGNGDGGAGNPFAQSLWVRATVVSVGPRRATVNAGIKALATDSGLPQAAAGAPEGTTYRFTGDEHGRLDLPEGAGLAPGDMVELVPSHCDPTVNLHAGYAVRRAGRIEGWWPVVGRYGAGPG